METLAQKKPAAPALVPPALKKLPADVAEMSVINSRLKTVAGKLKSFKFTKKMVNDRLVITNFDYEQFQSITRDTFDAAERLSKMTQELAQLVDALTLTKASEEPIDLDRIFAAIPKITESLDPSERGTRAMIRSKELVSSNDFCELMNWTKQALSKALTTNRVFYVEDERQRYYPRFFADPDINRRQLEAVAKILGDLPGSSKLQFFMNGRGSLGGLTPIEALKRGKLGAVKAAAEGFAE